MLSVFSIVLHLMKHINVLTLTKKYRKKEKKKNKTDLKSQDTIV